MIAQRQHKLFRQLRDQKIQNFLITCPHNVSYLTGFKGEDSFLFVNGEKLTIWSDQRYDEQIREECPDLAMELRGPTKTLIDVFGRFAKKQGLSSIHVESSSTSLTQWLKLNDAVGSNVLTPCAGVVEMLRERKDSFELEAIERAIDYAQRAFVSAVAMVTPGSTEKNIADAIESNIRSLGGAGSAFKTIVGVGPRAALPHGRPSRKTVNEDAFVLIDWGAKEELYLSDITRVIVTGQPTAKLRKVYQTVLDAQKAAINAIRPGVLMSEIDAIARAVIEQAGFGKKFTHSLGHSFGLQIHESIRLARGQDRPLEPDMVVTVEPGIYLPGLLGVRIEDDVLVTKSGCRVLTSLPKEWDQIIAR
jgi:Xaa-Pro aminopeptidase